MCTMLRGCLVSGLATAGNLNTDGLHILQILGIKGMMANTLDLRPALLHRRI